jgi:chemotaxis response regulator CheB
MPKEAVKRGGIDVQVSLDAIAGEIVKYGVH